LVSKVAVNPGVEEALVERVTAASKLFMDVAVTVDLPELPACRTKLLGKVEAEKPGCGTVRVMETVRLRMPLTPVMVRV
jgi:hypothetical protein